MADSGTEFDALLEIIADEATELHTINPDHELLRFLDPVLYKAEWDKELHEEFLNRFDPQEKLKVVRIRATYCAAIREALGRIPPKVTSGRTIPLQRELPETEDPEEEIPF
jgi:hypothetical protein